VLQTLSLTPDTSLLYLALIFMIYVFLYRARQSEIKKEQEQIKMDLDPSNPNWQFLKMIKDYQETLGELQHLGMNDPVSENKL